MAIPLENTKISLLKLTAKPLKKMQTIFYPFSITGASKISHKF